MQRPQPVHLFSAEAAMSSASSSSSSSRYVMPFRWCCCETRLTPHFQLPPKCSSAHPISPHATLIQDQEDPTDVPSRIPASSEVATVLTPSHAQPASSDPAAVVETPPYPGAGGLAAVDFQQSRGQAYSQAGVEGRVRVAVRGVSTSGEGWG